MQYPGHSGLKIENNAINNVCTSCCLLHMRAQLHLKACSQSKIKVFLNKIFFTPPQASVRGKQCGFLQTFLILDPYASLCHACGFRKELRMPLPISQSASSCDDDSKAFKIYATKAKLSLSFLACHSGLKPETKYIFNG